MNVTPLWADNQGERQEAQTSKTQNQERCREVRVGI